MKGNEIILKNDRRNLDAISTYQKKKEKEMDVISFIS